MTETPFFVKLKNRGLLHLEGPDSKPFLQNLITNDMGKLTPVNQIYACLLSPQGKFLHDFFVREGDGFLLLDCEGGERAQDLFKRLNMYRLRSDVKISLEENHNVYAVFGGHRQDHGLPDPRHQEMGNRSFEKPGLPEKPFEDWDRRRIKLCIPDGSRDLIVNKSTMDEARMDKLNAIDYEKGCYIGQELTARMHYRGLGKKHLKTVKLDNLPEKAELRSNCEDIGIALVRD
ncbi:MAG: YgfZ/GcvT domain-containing protein [Alphaproteobacteria bacterium]